MPSQLAGWRDWFLDKWSGKPEHTGMPDHIPDYELEEVLRLEKPEQMGVLFDETRNLIVGLLNDKAATVSQIADTMGMPKGTVGYHMKVLEDHGLDVSGAQVLDQQQFSNAAPRRDRPP